MFGNQAKFGLGKERGVYCFMKTIGVIPARYGSTRFPGKPLHKIADQTLIEWVIDAAKTSKKLSQIIVATDHKDIFNLATRKGVEAVMTDSELPSGSDRVWQAVQKYDCDIVLNIQGDEPLLKGRQIDCLVECMLSARNAEMATLAAPIKNVEEIESLNVVKLILNQNKEAIYFSRFAIPFTRGIARDYVNATNTLEKPLKHIGMYAYKRNFLKQFCETQPTWLEKMESLEQLRALWLGAKIQVEVGDFECIGVDTPEDAKKVEKWLREKRNNQN